MIGEEVEKRYRDVQTVLEDALDNAESIKLMGQDENAELSEIRKLLETLNSDFMKDIETLKNSSEWDKFCIAFFGETNAGKSTIIESLRIIYDEETRRAEAMAQKDGYTQLMRKHCEDYQNLISSLESVNVALKNTYGKNYNWLFCLLTGIAGVVIGLILANLGIVVW